MKIFLPLALLLLSVFTAKSQCSSGSQSTYGTGNVWIGYAYNNANLTSFRGRVNEGSSASPNFDQDFGGSDVHYSTSGCNVRTEGFSMRYRLTKIFTSGNYTFTVGGDDGYRLSLDGGATWVINRWTDQPYTTATYTAALSGTYNLVLEYYDNSGENRISFSVAAICSATENTSISGTGDIWNGYVYDGTDFNTYVGMVHKGSASDPSFDENFEGENVSYPTSGCPIQTETFSVRYRLSKTFAPGTYMFTVGGDDGYRLSLNGGSSWIINNWALHSYTTTSYSASLNGTYDMVLEYYENAVANRVSFAMQTLSLLPITLQSFTAKEKEHAVQLSWDISSSSNPRSFEIERSIDGTSFSGIGLVEPNSGSATQYNFTDQSPFRGTVYYRLKMTDMNGITTYSATVSIRIAAARANKINIYPTIVTGSSFFVTAGSNIQNAVITITGLSGNIIAKHKAGNIAAGQAVRVSTGSANAGKGIYAVIISGSNFEMTTGKIIIP